MPDVRSAVNYGAFVEAHSEYFDRYIADRTNFPACLHVETNSLLLLRVDNSGLKIIKYFSPMQRLHFLLVLE